MSDKVAEGLDAVFEVTEAALAYVRPEGGFNADKFAALVNAVTNYREVCDPDAAKRNRDEHGPDIPTEHLDWRDKL